MKKVAILLATGLEEVEAITPIDFLRRANIDVITCSIDNVTVVGSHGVKIQADCTIDALPTELDAVILPGGMPGALNLSQSSEVTKLLLAMDKNKKLVAAICAAPAVVLAPIGLLNSRSFTCYPSFEEGLNEGEFSTECVVQDGHLITSRGPGTAAEFSIAVIEYLTNTETAMAVKQETLQNC